MTPAVLAQAVPSQFLRYLCVGGAATVLHYAVFALALARLPAAASWPGLAAAAGATAGAVLSYRLNRWWTFRCSRGHHEAAPTFVLVATTSALLAGLLVQALAAMLGPWPAQVLATGITTFLGFIAHRTWTFKT